MTQVAAQQMLNFRKHETTPQFEAETIESEIDDMRRIRSGSSVRGSDRREQFDDRNEVGATVTVGRTARIPRAGGIVALVVQDRATRWLGRYPLPAKNSNAT